MDTITGTVALQVIYCLCEAPVQLLLKPCQRGTNSTWCQFLRSYFMACDWCSWEQKKIPRTADRTVKRNEAWQHNKPQNSQTHRRWIITSAAVVFVAGLFKWFGLYLHVLCYCVHLLRITEFRYIPTLSQAIFHHLIHGSRHRLDIQ